MSRERQKILPWIFVSALLVSAATFSFSFSSNPGLRRDGDGNMRLEWPGDTGTLYAVYWKSDLLDRWHLLGEVAAETSAVALVDEAGIGRPSVSNSEVQARFYAVRTVVPTVVSSDVTSNTVWTLTEGPYVLTNQISVLNGATLTIEPGVVVRAEGSGTLVVSNGALWALGTTNEPITFARVGVVFEDGAIDRDCVLSDIAFVNAGITCRSSSPAIVHCSIRGSSGCGIVLEGSSPLISDCSIYNHSQGGIDCNNSSPTIQTCRITFNFGSGVRCRYGSAPLIIGSQLDHNISSSFGGGVLSESSSPTIQDCVVAQNSAGYGAGLCLRGSTASVRGCTIVSNGAPGYFCSMGVQGGGIYCESSSPEIIGCVINANQVGRYSQNQVEGRGAGLYIDEHSGPALYACFIQQNHAAELGGGVYCMSSNLVAENCLITGNRVLVGGGGIQLLSGQPVLRNCTIADNSADGMIGGSPFLQNCVIWGNSGTQLGGWPTLLNCIVEGQSYQKNPKFISGGYHLHSGSSCIDAGDPTNAPMVDIEGTARMMDPFSSNAVSAVDIGAYECVDSDADHLADFWEMQLFSNLLHDATGDLDEDGLTDIEEAQLGTDFNNPDTDMDGLRDADEVAWHSNPLDPDTDEDGYDDGDEVAGGTDPLDTRDFPYTPHVVINEIMYYPTNRVAWRNQFIELYNPCDHDVNLSGWTLSVSQYGRGRDVVEFNDGPVIMGPTSYYLIGGPFMSSVDGRLADWITDPGLNPLEDESGSVVELRLHNKGGEAVDGFLYGAIEPGQISDDFPYTCSFPPQTTAPQGSSISRVVDGQDRNRTSDWCVLESPTPRGAGTAEMFDPEDLDRDGLSLGQELVLGTDPEDADSDGDGILDGDEVARGLNPASFDSDGDGIHDDEEIRIGTNPAAKDTDGDGLWDSVELVLGTDPCAADSDSDGVPDGAEDTDGDSFSDEDEQYYGTSASSAGSSPATDCAGDPKGRPPSVEWDIGAAYDKTYRIKDKTYFVQDFLRETTIHFFNASERVIVFIPIRHGKKGHHSYRVSNATLATVRGDLHFYAAEVPPSGLTVTITELLVGYRWPDIGVYPPSVFDVSMPLVCPADEEKPGAVLLLNDDDDDMDDKKDLEDEHVPGADDDLVPLYITLPSGCPSSLSWDNNIVRIYEHPSKKLACRTGGGWIFNAEIGKCIPNRPYKGYDDAVVFLEGVKPGATWVTVHCASYAKRIKITVVKAHLVPDYDHNRVINDDDKARAQAGESFRFWINDDDDQTADSGDDRPGASNPDAGDGKVDSVRDLVDFFPVHVDMGDMLENMDEDDFFFALDQGEGVTAFLFPGLTPQSAGSYLTDASTAEGVASKPVKLLSDLKWGATLGWSFLDGIRRENRGVVLVEASQRCSSPLALNMYTRRGIRVAQWKLPLSISGVEEMYRWVNLRHVTGGSENRGTDTDEPANYPDSECNGKQFVFVTGFNCDENGARGWNAEIFKRMYWSGSHAMFTALTWYGDETPGILWPATYYHADVINSLQTAPTLASQVAELPGQKCVAAHSLGNMVASSAIVDHGLDPLRYFMIDAAVAMEAYIPTFQYPEEIAESPWLDYTNRLWASEWYKLFADEADGRNGLTWRNRFGDIPQAINYYSTGEDVLNNNDPPENMNVPQTEKAWVFQEKVKGGLLPAILAGVDSHGGWSFNSAYDVQVDAGEYGNPIYGTMPADQAAQLSGAQLRTNSFFKRFYRDDLYGPAGSAVAADAQVRTKLLAEAVPSTSRAAGRNELTGFGVGSDGNEDLMSMKNGWPSVRSNGDWLHSDLKNVAFLYVYQFFEDMVAKGGLQ